MSLRRTERGSGVAGWAMRYPPLIGLVAVLVIVVAVLPSALRVPLTNPQTVPEYAPVPPQDESSNPAGGNFGSLALANSSYFGGAAPEPSVDSLERTVVGKTPQTKLCVGNPPRQTEDPLSPPCVAYFKGDNFGSTYQGVTRGEIRVIFDFDSCGYGGRGSSSRGVEKIPINTYYDLAKPPSSDEFVSARVLRVLQRYFNNRFQTYGRFVHFYVHFGRVQQSQTGCVAWRPEDRRADAAEETKTIHPFATVSYLAQNADAYIQAMTRYGTVVFIGAPGGTSPTVGQTASYYAQHPGMVWSFQPSIDQHAKKFASYVCRKVVGRPVSFSGNPGENGKPRKLGLVRTNNQANKDFIEYARQTRALVEKCGGKFADEATFQYVYNASPTGPEQSVTADMARFKQEGITTLIWPGGLDAAVGNSAGTLDYYPEFVIAGDGNNDGNGDSTFQNQRVWSQVRMITEYTRIDNRKNQPCYQSALEADPNTPDIDIRHYLCVFYQDVRQLFTGVQVAGPRLNPSSMDQGFHAIPRVESKDPSVPACFYEPGDYTCEKDAVPEWWDPNGTPPDQSSSGCYKMMEGGRRYLADTWKREDVDAQKRSTDRCNAQGVTAQ